MWFLVFNISIIWLILALFVTLVLSAILAFFLKQDVPINEEVIKSKRFSRSSLFEIYLESSSETLERALRRAGNNQKKRLVLEKVNSSKLSV